MRPQRDSRFVSLVLILGCVGVAHAPEAAYAGALCDDVCGPVSGGQTCQSIGLGCAPLTRLCGRCENDDWCRPGGTCLANGSCANVNCNSMDAGSPGDSAQPDGDLPEAGSNDGGPEPVDSGTPVVDSGPGPVDSGPAGGSQGRGKEKTEIFDPPNNCNCRDTHFTQSEETAVWSLLLAFGLIRRRKAR